MMEEKVYTPREIAEHFKVSIKVIQKWIREGKLKAIRLGNVWRVPESALQEFIKLNRPVEKKE